MEWFPWALALQRRRLRLYKLVFADDEKLVLDKICRMVDWESNGFTLVGRCANGYEVMEVVERELPDLVILDVNMPFITGLEAARQIRHSYPRIRVAFLTAYAEFEYAKQAVELNAMKYIVKPVSACELEAVLREARASLDAEHAQIRQMTDLVQFHQENRKMLVRDLLDDDVRGDAVYERVRANGLNWSESTYFLAAVFSVDSMGRGASWAEGDEKAMLYALANVIEELAQETKVGLSGIRRGVVVLIAYSDTEANFERRVQEFAESVLQVAAAQLQFSVTCGQGSVHRGCAQIGAGCAEAVRALELRAKEGGGQLFTAQDLNECNGSHTAVWNAVNYIESTYADPNLSADAVCEHLHLSPSYLRALFKRETGSTIIGYITKARMERAKTLLQDAALRNGQVAERVGYVDPHYFSYCFKRYFGATPNEMREKIRTV